MHEMIRMFERFIILFICCAIHFNPTSVSGQGAMVGLEYGYGRSQMTSHGHSFISPFDPDFFARWNIGIQYNVPVSPWLSVSSGLEYIRRTELYDSGIEGDEWFSNLAIPFRVDFTLGNTFQFLIGPGLDLTFLVDYDLGYYKNHSGFEESKNVVQANWQFHTGFGFLIKPRTRIYFLYEQGFDLTKVYCYHNQNADYMLSERWYDGFLSVGVMTSMKSGKKK